MNFNHLIERVALSIVQTGMPLVHFYHVACDNIFLNSAAQESSGLEMVGNCVLAPVHYLFAGTVAIEVDAKDHFYHLKQRFEYNEYFALKTVASIIALPVSLAAGTAIKGLSYFSVETRERHHAIAASLSSTRVDSNNEYYCSIGIDIEDFEMAPLIGPPEHIRMPGEENLLSIEKSALLEIGQIFQESKIPYWVDCGTCLGAYRYGGVIPWDNDVDIAILAPDFQNVKHALNRLDKNKYIVQDWSGRNKPGTYLKIYIKENGALIDIYHFDIDPTKKMITFILSNEGSIFLPKSWKIREGRYVVSTPFEHVFPLKKAELDNILVPVPHETKKYLQGRYGDNIEPAKIYSEETGFYEKDLSHPYWKIECVR